MSCTTSSRLTDDEHRLCLVTLASRASQRSPLGCSVNENVHPLLVDGIVAVMMLMSGMRLRH